MPAHVKMLVVIVTLIVQFSNTGSIQCKNSDKFGIVINVAAYFSCV